MKVLHLVHAFQTGGAERVVLNLIRHGAHPVENLVCSLTGGGELARELEGTGAGFHCLHKRNGNDPFVVPALARLIDARGIDLVHSQNWGTYLEGLVAAKIFAKRRPAFVFAFHGKSLEEAKAGLPFRRRLAQRLAYRMTDACVVPAAHMAADYARTVGVPRDRIRVIYNGIDTTGFQGSPDHQVRAEFGFRPNDFVIGFVGRLDAVKDVRGIVVTFAMLQSALASRGRARLLMIGDGKERELALRVAAERGVDKDLVLAGMRSDVPRCMSVMDVYFQPSYYEGHSLTILEAMAAGLPVISTAVGGTPEIVSDGRNGFLHSPGDYASMAGRLLDLQADPALRSELGTAARADVARRFSVAAMVESYENLYRQLLRAPEQRCVA